MIKRAACLININSKKEILVVTRRNSDYICMPGGKLDEGETEIDAIIREVFEETGCIIEKENIFPLYTEFASNDKDFWTTCYYSNLDLIPFQKEEGIVPFYVTKEIFISNKAIFRNFNKEVLIILNKLFSF